MPPLADSQHTTTGGGNFVDQSIGITTRVTNVSLENGQTGIDILLEASNPDAAYDSLGRDYAPRCQPGTREQYIEAFLGWGAPAVGAGEPLPLFWMKGLAGIGKSAIAQTCAENLEGLGKLGATFFFSVNIRDDAEQFFPTIAYQLSIKLPEYRHLVDQKIRHDKTIVKKTMAAQFKTLIADPFQELEKTGKGISRRIVVIVDGLDECKSSDDQCRIVEIVAAAARDGVTPLCWAFFSCPEPRIEATFNPKGVAQVTCKTSLPISNEADLDIELYLYSGFANILQRRNISVMSQWPSDNDIQTLVKASNGLFVYAATVLRDVDQAASPTEALRAACAVTSHRTDTSPFAGLDAFYTLIMRRIPPGKLPTVLLLCLLLCDSVSYPGSGFDTGVMEQSNILGLSEIAFREACNQLSAVLHAHDHSDSFDFSQFGDTDRPLQYLAPAFIKESLTRVHGRIGGTTYFYHKSFYDFLMNPTRSGSFTIRSSSVRNAYFRHNLGVMFKYEASYCFRGSELALAPGVADSASSLSWPYTNELVNSILKARVYEFAFDTCFHFCTLPEMERQLVQPFGSVDFRKAQQNVAMLYDNSFVSYTRWGCDGPCKFINGTRLFCVPRNEFREKFDVIYFKAKIKRWKESGFIEPYYPDPGSRFKSLVPKKSQDRLISGLFRLGHGPKSILWYWEIDSKEKKYQDFMAADLAEGERIYREERFDLWPTHPWRPT